MPPYDRLDTERALQHLPGLPAAGASALHVLRNEDDRERLYDVVSQDRGLSARLLRVLNSPFFVTAPPVDTVRSACLYAAPKTLERAIIASTVLGLFPGGSGNGLDRYGFWEHSVGVGVISRTLAGAVKGNGELAFTGGLLHDLGRLIMDVYFPREFQAVLRYQQRHDTWIRDAELAVAGIDHCRLGARVAERWALPDDLVEVVRCHHQPEGAGVRHGATLVVHVADVLARGLEFGNPGDDTIPLLSQVAMKRLGLNWEDLRFGLQEVEDLLPEARSLVNATIGAEATVSA